MFDWLGKNDLKAIFSFNKVIQQRIYSKIANLKIEAWTTPEPNGYRNRTNGTYKVLKEGDKWGDIFDCAWFHFTGKVPNDAKNKHIVLLIDINGELCVFDSSGCPIRGLTNGSSTFEPCLGAPGKRVLEFAKITKGGETVDIWADGGCNDLFGKLKNNGVIEEASIAICEDNIRKLFYSFEVLENLYHVLPENSARKAQILYNLHKVTTIVKQFSQIEVEKANNILDQQLNKKNGDNCFSVSAIGHAHLDLAWLWPIRETIRKGARTFSTVIDLMDKYPDYKFGASQAQLYKWVKDYYPQLYEKIKNKINQKRWEVQGGMWVEADTNITGGESLIRQLLYGKKFFKDEFDIDIKNLWLPDVFGYSVALPQIMKKCGIEYFMTQKMSWNEFNVFPRHTFIWEGNDGSKILTHMLPEETYNAPATPEFVSKGEKNFKDKDVSDQYLMLFGIGNGGGGPGAEHLERLDRMKNLNGIAPVKQEFGRDFFEKISKNKENYRKWHGELYLEFHRGTFTTQAKLKKYNRDMENYLRHLEFVSSISKKKYLFGELEDIWKEVLLYQFHDILPGSSIKRVNDECHERYEKLMDRTKELIRETEDYLYSKIDTSDYSKPAIALNTLSWERDNWLKIDDNWYKATVPSMGYSTIETNNPISEFPEIIASENLLENNLLRVKFDVDGSICSVFDKEIKREILKDNQHANRLTVYADNEDAWDFPKDYYMTKPEYFSLVSSKASADGPYAILEQEYKYNKSILTQKIHLRANNRRIDFVTNVNWQERLKMLRTSFPLNIYSNEATCDIQFGSIKRPTHNNTSWDIAKFEVCAHKYVDISHDDYGVALMNNCKYGYRVLDNTLDLNLLRSTEYPGKDADRGKHEFTYSLYPHTGSHNNSDIIKEAYDLNIPLQVRKLKSTNGNLPTTNSFFSLDTDHVMINTIKISEDEKGIVIRLHETHGKNTNTILSCSLKINSVFETNMLEENQNILQINNNTLFLNFTPWEIKTIKLKIK